MALELETQIDVITQCDRMLLRDGEMVLAVREMNLRTDHDYAIWAAARAHMEEHNRWAPLVQAATIPGVIPDPEAKQKAETAFMAAVRVLFPDYESSACSSG